MAEKLTLKIVTPLREVVVGEADMVVLPAYEGEMGVLPGHDYYMAMLDIGALKMVHGEDAKYFFVARGFAEIGNDQVRILAEVCESVDEIDVDRAAASQKRAEERLASAVSDTSINIARARASLHRALLRQEITRGQFS